MTNDMIIERIKSGGQAELGMVYEQYRSEFIQWIMKEYNCTSDDSKDIYQVTILIFYDNIKLGKLEKLVSSVKTYLFAIGKNIAMENYRKTSRYSSMNQEKWLRDYLIDQDDQHPYEDQFDKVKVALEKLGQPCQRLIELFYYDKKSMDEIATVMNYKNSETAKNQKCKCMARLRKLFDHSMKTQPLV